MMNTLDVIEEIITSNANIKSVTFHEFPKQKLLQNQIEFSDIEERQFEEAMKIRNTYNLPFWDSMMLTYFNKEKTSNNILKCALRHNSHSKEIKSRDIDSIKSRIIDNPDENIAFNSKVTLLNGDVKHLPLLDFHIPVNENNQKQVEKILELLDLKSGYIMISGESYHYIGNQLMDESSLFIFLSKALLFSPIIDKSWIAHQLLEHSCSLRVTLKHNIEPKLIKILK